MVMAKISFGSVIQANENAPKELCGSLLIVDEISDYGVLAHIKIPYKGDAFFRIKWEQFDYVGEALLIPEKGDSDHD